MAIGRGVVLDLKRSKWGKSMHIVIQYILARLALDAQSKGRDALIE